MITKKALSIMLALSMALLGLTACQPKKTEMHLAAKTLYDEAANEYTEMTAKARELGENIDGEIEEELDKLNLELKSLKDQVEDDAFKKLKGADLEKINADLANTRERISNLSAQILAAEIEASAENLGDAIVDEAKKLYEEAKTGFDNLVAKTEDAVDDLGDDIKENIQKAGEELEALGKKIENSEAVTMAKEELEKMKDELIELKDRIVLTADKIEDAL